MAKILYPYSQADSRGFQSEVVDLANEINKNLNNVEELKNIARTLKILAYNRPIELPTKESMKNWGMD